MLVPYLVQQSCKQMYDSLVEYPWLYLACGNFFPPRITSNNLNTNNKNKNNKNPFSKTNNCCNNYVFKSSINFFFCNLFWQFIWGCNFFLVGGDFLVLVLLSTHLKRLTGLPHMGLFFNHMFFPTFVGSEKLLEKLWDWAA